MVIGGSPDGKMRSNGMNIEMAKQAFLAAIWSPGIDGDRRQSRWKNA
jgi:hypothetical protein